MKDDAVCVIACGMAWGDGSDSFDEIMARADERMYLDKLAKKRAAGEENPAVR